MGILISEFDHKEMQFLKPSIEKKTRKRNGILVPFVSKDPEV